MKFNLNKYLLVFLLLTSITFAKTTIDTLVLYSMKAKEMYNGDIETRINHLFAFTNKVYKNSGLDIELVPVKIILWELDENIHGRRILSQVQQDANITALRNSVGADEVIIYRPYLYDGSCGVAYVNKNREDLAYAHVSINCPNYITGHEVGHNMSLWHSASQNPGTSFNRGHGVKDKFVTMMKYKGVSDAVKIYKFSDPDLDCNGDPCGIEEGLENEADAVKAIRVQAPIIANFRESIAIDNNNTELANAKKAYDEQYAIVQALIAGFNQKLDDEKKIHSDNKQKIYNVFLAKYMTFYRAYISAVNDLDNNLITRSECHTIISGIYTQVVSAMNTYKEAFNAERLRYDNRVEELGTNYNNEYEKLQRLKKIYYDLVKANEGEPKDVIYWNQQDITGLKLKIAEYLPHEPLLTVTIDTRERIIEHLALPTANIQEGSRVVFFVKPHSLITIKLTNRNVTIGGNSEMGFTYSNGTWEWR